MRIHNLALPLLRAILDAPLRAMILVGLVAALAGWYATDLRVDTDLANLLPEGHPSVVALNELKETVGGETPLQVAIKSIFRIMSVKQSAGRLRWYQESPK